MAGEGRPFAQMPRARRIARRSAVAVAACFGAAVVLMVLAAGGLARAQERRVSVLAGGTVMAPLSGTADSFDPGLGGTAGLVWHLSEQAGLRVDGTWSTLSAKNLPATQTGGLEASGRVQSVTAAFVFQAPPGRARLYVLGGVGLYRRVTALSGGGAALVAVCNPWWFVCATEPVAASSFVGSRSSTNPGVTVGFGVSVGHLFGELRYHYVFGPTYRTPSGDVPASGKLLPLTIGVRF